MAWPSPREAPLTRDARAVLRPQVAHLDPAVLQRRFTLRTSEAFMECLAAPLVAAIARAAPRVQLRFVAKPDKEAQPLREGQVDLEIGVLGTSAPEIRTHDLFHDKLVGVARTGHPLLDGKRITIKRFAACHHVVASQAKHVSGPVDAALNEQGLQRAIKVVVPGYPDAMRIARGSDLIALVPRSCLGHALAGNHDAASGLASFELPLPLPEFAISAIWHPRLDNDPAHLWLRETVVSVCREAYPST